MKNKLLLFAICTSGIYALISAVLMIGYNKAPYQLQVAGKKLNTKECIVLSNKKHFSKDTIIFPFKKLKHFTPATLAYVKYNSSKNKYLLQLSSDIASPGDKTGLKPFCKRLNNKGSFFGPNTIIEEEMLIKPGVKFNTYSGVIKERITLKILFFNGEKYLQYNQEGFDAQYLVKNGTDTFGVFENCKQNTIHKFIFDFTETSDTANYQIITKASIFNTSVTVGERKYSFIPLKSLNYFPVGDLLFCIKTKYSIGFMVCYSLFVIIIFFFQLIYWNHLNIGLKAPTLLSLIKVRLLLNSLILLSTPLILSAWYLTEMRWLYLVLVIILNVSYFLPKTAFHYFNGFRYSKKIFYTLISILLSITFLLAFKSENECLYTIPVLHVTKFLILLAIFIFNVYNNIFRRRLYVIKYMIIFSFVILWSLITDDLGSIIFVSLSFLLILLLKNSLSSFQIIKSGGIALIIMIILFNIFPERLTENKAYRLVAPYVLPDSEKLINANETDRETYAQLWYNLKNVITGAAPMFNNLHISPNMRSTMFSDYAVHWSFIFGSYYFFTIFLIVIFQLINEYIKLLITCLFEFKISDETSFNLSKFSESEFIRFFIAITIIQTIYPVLSNMLILPITGQSIPAFCVSIWEIIFITVLVIVLENIYTNNKKYISDNNKMTSMQYGNIIDKSKYVILSICVGCLVLMLLKFTSICISTDVMSWKKGQLNTNNFPAINKSNKEAIIESAIHVFNNIKNEEEIAKNKNILRELAYLHFSGKSRDEITVESTHYYLSKSRVNNALRVNTFINKNYELISGSKEPFGKVYKFTQYVNNNLKIGYTNQYYNCIANYNSNEWNDLTAECNLFLERHINELGIPNNIGSITVINNQNGQIIVNSSYPFNTIKNSNEINYKIGSVKKLIVAYAALKLIPDVKDRKINNRTFKEFIQWSDNKWATTILTELLTFHLENFTKLLKDDFDMSLCSAITDGYLDHPFNTNDLKDTAYIKRMAIGHEKTYNFLTVMQWYVRFVNYNKMIIRYADKKSNPATLSLKDEDNDLLKECFNTVFNGTAIKVKKVLSKENINTALFICKTGTAQLENKQGNYSSTFIIADNQYTIGIMISGLLPPSNENLMAKDLFIKLVPALKKYSILK